MLSCPVCEYGYVFNSWQFPLVLALVGSGLRKTIGVALQGMVSLERLEAERTSACRCRLWLYDFKARDVFHLQGLRVVPA